MAESGRAEELLAGYRVMLGEELVAERCELLLAYLDLLVHWNRSYNLTAVRDPAQMVSRHLLDSLAVLPWLEAQTPAHLLDAGTGAGLPGVPLAIMRPGMHVTLLDSAGKKIRFLRHVKRELGLDNISPVQDRLEEFLPPELSSGPPDFPSAPPDFPSAIISRAFSELAQFAAAARHLLGPDTKLLAMKGRRPDAEMARLPAWIRVDRVEKLSPPGLHEERHLVIMSLTA
ncbi:MAG: 16S rRNA (guanine(527)-N(7))-methyltransferase RsmG [Xanthomonadales bacterium]|nr:16S rRNA (guanine(527)-N(7))-methyltransferase RsmG [Xanthomonadales bacterium]